MLILKTSVLTFLELKSKYKEIFLKNKKAILERECMFSLYIPLYSRGKNVYWHRLF